MEGRILLTCKEISLLKNVNFGRICVAHKLIDKRFQC